VKLCIPIIRNIAPGLFLAREVAQKELADADMADQGFHTVLAPPACVPCVPALLTGHGVAIGQQQVEDWLRANK